MKDLMPFRPTNFRVGITQMLAARDERVIRQRIWLNRHGSSLISFCINMPGEIKDNTESHQIHLAGIDAVNRLLKQQGWPVRAQASWRLVTGPEAFWSVAIPPEELKKALIILEQQHPLGRLFDLDVLNAQGTALSRKDFDLTPRRCLVCDELAAVCGRSRAHDINELLTHIRQRIHDFQHEDESCQSALIA